MNDLPEIVNNQFTTASQDYVIEFKLRKLELLKRKAEVQGLLPHIYGWPWYKWAWEFYNNCTDDVQILCAANQISKSSTQIRKCIDWATAQDKWPAIWGRKPNMFWYLYPSKDVATAEFEKKWEPEFMPRGSMKKDPIYGWDAIYEKKQIKQINFHSGVSVYFKTYMQDSQSLQSGSVYSIFCDEELPEDLYSELQFRTEGTRGFFHMVFTATLGQEIWWRAMEAIGTDGEFLPKAWKKTISMYDCLQYADGTPAPWTNERIEGVIAKCKSKSEVLRRVYGRFIKEEGRTIHQFDPTKHYIKPFDIPKHWPRYVAVDIGGGGDGHPSAITYIACTPDYKKGYVYKGWRGDNLLTTAGDVYEKHKELSGKFEHFSRKSYDGAAKDFGIIAQRLGAGFVKATKGHDIGEDTLNTILKHNMLQLFDTEEVRKLGGEMMSLQKSTPKNKAKDDFVDSARYCAVDIPWNYEGIKVADEVEPGEKIKMLKDMNREEQFAYEVEQRRMGFSTGNDKIQEPAKDWQELNDEIEEWNEAYGN